MLFVIGNGSDDANRNDVLRVETTKIHLDLAALPTSDPTSVGQLWRSGTDLKISLG